MHRNIPAALALTLIAPALSAQVAPSPDSTTMGDKSAMPAPATAQPQDAPSPATTAPGTPSDMHTTPPPVASQAPPAASGDAASAGTAAKGRAKPSSVTKKTPR